MTGLLDLGSAGVRDRHYDLFWGRWSLWYNSGSDDLWDIFLNAYGRENYREESMRATAAGMLFCH